MRARFGAAIALMAMVALWGCSTTGPTATGSVGIAAASTTDASTTGSVKPAPNGYVYLIRGGLNVFSTGMDEIAEKLRARGIAARSEGHAIWEQLADEARKRYETSRGPIVIVGHSWGAIAANLMAEKLAKTGTPVALVILYDTTESLLVPRNVVHVINLRSSTGIGLGLTVTGVKGYPGKIDNFDITEFSHTKMDNAPSMHERTIADILKVIQPSPVTQ